MKNMRKVLLIVAVLFSALLSFTIYFYLNEQNNTTVVEGEQITIIVANETIPPRTRITKEMLATLTVLDDGFYNSFIGEPTELIGQYTKETILAGEGFRTERIIVDLESELSLKIQNSFRAIAVQVTHETGVSDLIKTGDWIDLIISLPELKESERISRPQMTKLFMQNVEVLAVDRSLFRQENYREESPQSYTLTLAVPANEIEKFVLAKDLGTITVALRPLDGDFIYQTGGAIWEELIIDDFNRIKDLYPQYEIVSAVENAETPVEIEKYIYYTVKYKDTLRSIANDFYGDELKFTLIKTVNRIDDEDLIVVGTALKIPVLAEVELEPEAGETNEGSEN
jgi:pilus assembly protein CpaB